MVNSKCDPIRIGALWEIPAFLAYHMGKDRWITVVPDDSVADDNTKMRLDMSYQATAPKMRKKKY